MAKKKVKPTKDVSANQTENVEIEQSDVVLSEVKTKQTKADKNKEKEANNKNNKKAAKKKAKNDKPRRNFVKEIFSELKKVNWPSFKQACARTGTVLIVVAVFMFVILGIDLLLTWLVSLIVV